MKTLNVVLHDLQVLCKLFAWVPLKSIQIPVREQHFVVSNVCMLNCCSPGNAIITLDFHRCFMGRGAFRNANWQLSSRIIMFVCAACLFCFIRFRRSCSFRDDRNFNTFWMYDLEFLPVPNGFQYFLDVWFGLLGIPQWISILFVCTIWSSCYFLMDFKKCWMYDFELLLFPHEFQYLLNVRFWVLAIS